MFQNLILNRNKPEDLIHETNNETLLQLIL